MISDRLGLILRQLRLDRKLSQQEMADRAHVLRGYLSRVECGKTIPGWENMERFALTLGVGVAEIIRLAEAPVEVKVVEGAGPVLVESSRPS